MLKSLDSCFRRNDNEGKNQTFYEANFLIQKICARGASACAARSSLAQTPGPDLAWQDAAMENQAFISNENNCISTSRRARAGCY